MKTKLEPCYPCIKHFICEVCEVEMEVEPMVLLSNPAQYQYTCPKCGKVETSTESPGIAFVTEAQMEVIEKMNRKAAKQNRSRNHETHV